MPQSYNHTRFGSMFYTNCSKHMLPFLLAAARKTFGDNQQVVTFVVPAYDASGKVSKGCVAVLKPSNVPSDELHCLHEYSQRAKEALYNAHADILEISCRVGEATMDELETLHAVLGAEYAKIIGDDDDNKRYTNDLWTELEKLGISDPLQEMRRDHDSKMLSLGLALRDAIDAVVRGES